MHSYKKMQPCVELGNPWFHSDYALGPKTLDGSLRRNLQKSPKTLVPHSRRMGRSSMGGGASVSNTEVMISTAAVTSSSTCPLALCYQEMQPETSRDNAGYDSTTGLRCFRCPTYGHIGRVAAGGLQLVFRLAHQYVLTHDPYRSTITALLPAHTIAMCQTYGLDAEGLAKHAAEWALLSGNRSDTVS